MNIPSTFSGRINSIEVKGIVVIDYNYLNLPEYVSRGPQQQMRYIYDASGRKISQEAYDDGGLIIKKSDYEREFFFENDTLRFISHDEGRVVMKDSGPEYQYNLKDHLGNVRLTFRCHHQYSSSVGYSEFIIFHVASSRDFLTQKYDESEKLDIRKIDLNTLENISFIGS